MSEKKKFGKFLALATAAGAVAAGVSYFLKYRSFHKELDQDFHDFENEDDDDFDGTLPHESEAASRTYVTLGEKKEAVEDVAKEAADVAAEAGKEAVEALTALGYSASEAQTAVKKVTITETMTSEDVLKGALKHLAFL